MPNAAPRPRVPERVLSTADRLFYAEGIHAVGIDRIIAEAGVAKASLYAHFRSKDDLVAAYLGGRSQAWQAHVHAELAARGGAPLDRLLAVFELLGEWFGTPGYRGCPFINAAAECGDDTRITELTGRHRAWVGSLFTDLLDESGVASSAAVAMQLVLLYDGAMVAAQLDPASDAATAARSAASVLVTTASTTISASGRVCSVPET